MDPLRTKLQKLHANLNALRSREASYGGHTPVELLNLIADHQQAIALVEQTLAGQISPAALQTELAGLTIDLNLVPTDPPEPPPLTAYQLQRLHDIEHHIRQRLELLRAFEDVLAAEDNPRRILRYRKEIEREKAALADFQQQAAELGAAPGQPGSPAVEAVQDGLAALSQKLEGLDHKLDALSQQVETGQQGLQADLSRQQGLLLAHMDQRHDATIAAIVQRLDAGQLEVVDLLLDAADRQQLAEWEANELTRLVQQSLLELGRLQQNRPDAGQWQRLLDILEQDVGWEQKLRLTLPLVPGILEFESEVQVDVMGVLNETWRRMLAKIER